MHRRSSALGLLLLALVVMLLPLIASSPVQAAITTKVFTTTADAYVTSAAPKKKFGTTQQLRVSGSPTQQSFLRFSVTDVPVPVTKAVLTLSSTKPVSVPLTVRGVTGSWTESGLSWSNKPGLGTTFGGVGSVPSGRLEIDVTDAVTASGTLNLALVTTSTSSTVAELASRETGTSAATLTVTGGVADTTPPPAPTGLSATAGESSVALTWAAVVDPDLGEYWLYRRVQGQAWPTEVTQKLAATQTAYTDAGLQNGTTYEYYVAAVDDSGNKSGPSGVATATPLQVQDSTLPAAPAAPSIVAGDGSATLTWQPNTEPDVRDYRIFRKPAAETAWATDPVGTTTGRTFTDSGLVNGTEYEYRLTAVDTSDNESSPSPSVKATPRPAPDTVSPLAPKSFTASAGDGSVALGWAPNDESDLAGYRVYRQSADGSWPATALHQASAPSTAWTDTSVTNGRSYTYRVTALDVTGNESPASVPASATPQAPADTTRPSAPAGLTASSLDGGVSLAWTPSPENDVAGYRIYRRTTSGDWPAKPLQEVSGTETVDRDVVAGTSYEYRVTALDTSLNESAPSASATVTPIVPADTTPPATPQHLTVTAGNAVATLGWTANPEPDLARYQVFRRVTGTEWPGQPTTSVTAPGWTDTSVVNGTVYEYRLVAVDTAGNTSQPSAPVTARPTSQPCAASSDYAASVLATPSLAAYWRLGDRSGTTACEARGIAPGVYNGGFSLGGAGALAADSNTAANFNGSTGYVKVTDKPALSFTSAMTAEAWLSPRTTAGSQTIIRKSSQYLFRVVDGMLVGRVWIGGKTYEAWSGPVVTAGRFQHVAMTYDGLALRVFRNGVQVASSVVSGTLGASTMSVYLGASDPYYDWVDGSLDEVAVYSTALAPQTLTSHYRVGAAIDGSGPEDLTALGAPTAIGLTWPAVLDATGYRVYQRDADGTWPAAPRATTTTTSYQATGLTDGQRYAFRVTAVVAGTESRPSVIREATPVDDVLLTAGDIAHNSMRSELTATLLDRNGGSVMTLGDNAYPDGSAADFASYYAPTWGRHLWRTRGVIGNHEYNVDNGTPYWDYFGAAAGPRGLGYYSYDLAGWHVIVLNSNCWYVGGCGAMSPQMQWLLSDLQASTARCTIAAWHHPLFSSGYPNGVDATMREPWQVLMSYGVEVVLTGHDHAYERFAPQDAYGVATPTGIREFIVGTGGASLYPTSTILPNSQVRSIDTRGILRLDLDPDAYSWRFIPVDGGTATDSGTDTCH